MRRLIPLVAATAALLACAPAQASTLGIQDDESAKYQPAAFAARTDQLHASWTRIMIPDNRWDGEQDAYVAAAARAHDRGQHVMVALLAYRTHPTGGEWARFARRVTARLAPYVDAWSPMNEPQWPSLSPSSVTTCAIRAGTANSLVTSSVRDGYRLERHWRKVRRGHGKYLRRVRYHRVKHRRVKAVSYVRARSRAQKRAANWTARITRVPLSKSQTVAVSTPWEQSQCESEALGIAYRRVWDAVAPVLRDEDPSARLIVGDLSPVDTDTAFMDAFYGGRTPDVRPDILGVHPYHWASPEGRCADGSFMVCSIEDAAAYARAHGLELWATEWAYQPGAPGAWWTMALDRFDRAGVTVTVLYDTGGNDDKWDTRLDAAAVDAVRSR